jgi:hypothetical protein
MLNAIASDRIPALAKAAIAQHQGVPLGIEPGPAYDMGIVGSLTRGACDRLGRVL